LIRSQALNDLYGEPEVTSQYKAMVRADRIRGEAMNRLAKSGFLTAPPVPSETVAGGGFDWTDFAIGLGAMFGFVLLAGALAGATLYARRGHARATSRSTTNTRPGLCPPSMRPGRAPLSGTPVARGRWKPCPWARA